MKRRLTRCKGWGAVRETTCLGRMGADLHPVDGAVVPRLVDNGAISRKAKNIVTDAGGPPAVSLPEKRGGG